MIEIQWVAADMDEAREIVQGLLKKKLIACANIIDGVESHYIWSGKMESAEETLCLMKADDDCFDDVESYIVDHCSYEVPAIIALPIDSSHGPYRKWVQAASPS